VSRREDIQNSIWGDPDFERLSADAKLLYLWSFTNPLCNMSGVYKVSELRMARDTNLPAARVSKALSELLEAGFLVYQDSLLWVRSRVKYMRTTSPTMARSITNDLKDVPADAPIFLGFMQMYEGTKWLRDELQKAGDKKPTVEPKTDTPSEGSARGTDGFHGNGNGYGKGSVSSSSVSRATDREDTEEIRNLCTLLADLIEANGSKRPTDAAVEGWRRDVRLMLEQDDRTPAQIDAAVRWSQANSFWRAHVMSMSKLREKWDTMRLQAEQGRRGSKVAEGNAAVLRMLDGGAG